MTCDDDGDMALTMNSFELKHGSEVKPVEEPAKLEHLSPVVDSVIKISETLEELEKIQHHMRVSEQSSRDSMSPDSLPLSSIQPESYAHVCVGM
jgi:hypothetical protein